MLILIAGITGMCGQPCARAALAKGHQVRGIGRNPDKLDADVGSKLESFVTTPDMTDRAALDKAVKGVDAIICALSYLPEVVVDVQLALLRVAERAGVKIFHGASWNYDWTKLQLGDHENYDAYLAFHRTAQLTSSIKPIYGFTGSIIEYIFYWTDRAKPLDKDTHTVPYIGTGDEKYIYITVDDLAAYTVAAIEAPGAAQGGNYYVESFRCTIREFAQMYGQARGGLEMQLRCDASTEMAEEMLAEARRTTDPRNWQKYIGLAYVTLMNNKKIDFDAVDSKRWAGQVKQTSLREWFEQHPDV
ncbi:hypothetical protein QBC46DRAFT_293140 [Diplogelasinospora grovesii]|uniref:NmrA-like domain-containing protein n=1 Tax=Diplogelasinospora grovesii TaxID=303347 RepID=A0AAN6N3B0_9PEZI|nr:hypothetical protein QBC46DRAFT_293140 [Diplogelasinospora grovesii]